MAQFFFDRSRSEEEARVTKSRLKEMYRWKYRYPPPAGWQADHQVEQFQSNYERFGPTRIHSMENMIMVPVEVNRAKNVLYNRPQSETPKRFRYVIQAVKDTRTVITNPLSIRYALYRYTQMMGDEEAWALQTAFSKDCLFYVIERLKQTLWQESPPEWYVKYPHWVHQMQEDIESHTHFVSSYIKHLEVLWKQR